MGVKVSGAGCEFAGADLAASYRCNNLLVSCTGYNLFKKADIAMFYEMNGKTKLSAVCKMASLHEMPKVEVGLVSKLSKDTELRAKVNSVGEVSGFYKATVDNRLTYSGSLTVDAAHLNGGNHKVGFGIEFIF